jgi:leader peptidase (prepilin peptidase)/N-methyltransferase
MLIFISGILAGLILNIIISSLSRRESVTGLPSYSPSPLSSNHWVWQDLLALAGSLLRWGKGRVCQKITFPRYPLPVVALNGSLWLLVYCREGFSLNLLKGFLLVSLLLVVTVIDLREQIIPDQLIVFSLVTGLLFLFFPGLTPGFVQALTGILTGGGLFLLIAVLSGGAMGGGDIKLMAVLGLWLGWRQILLVSFFAFISGAAGSLGLIALGRKNKKDYISFGPFIALAALLSFLWGNAMVKAYFGLFTG